MHGFACCGSMLQKHIEQLSAAHMSDTCSTCYTRSQSSMQLAQLRCCAHNTRTACMLQCSVRPGGCMSQSAGPAAKRPFRHAASAATMLPPSIAPPALTGGTMSH